MDNQDIFNKIKSAAENAETKDFPSMEKVWSRIDAKLDTHVEKKHSNNWKNLFIAASTIVVITIGYRFLKPTDPTINTKESIVKTDSTQLITPKLDVKETELVTTDEHPTIKKEADKIIEKQIANQNQVATIVAEEKEIYKEEDKQKYDAIENAPVSNSPKNIVNTVKSSNNWTKEKNYEANGVTYKHESAAPVILQDKINQEPQEPLVVINDELRKDGLSELDDIELETIIALKEPLYIINGVEYTEEELFGENPTSPYYPIKKQKIETFSVLQPEKAVALYGKKGEKGIVIITTKDGKPRVFKNK